MKYTLIFLDMVPLEEKESQLPAVELLEIARRGVWNTDAVVNRVTVEPSGICLEVEAEFYVECEPSELPKIVAQYSSDDIPCTVLDEKGMEVSLRRSCVLNFDDSATFGGAVNLSALSEEGLEAKIKADYFGFVPNWASVTRSDIEVNNGEVSFTADVVYEADGLGEFIERVRELVWECIRGKPSSFGAAYGGGDGKVTVTERDFNAQTVYTGDLFDFKEDDLPWPDPESSNGSRN
jgi:hypothetical protein